jgi:hypothetical protein
MVGNTHVVSLLGLRRRLRTLLGDDNILFQRLDVAIRRQDQASIAAAMAAMRLYPPPVQKAVEQAMLDWLREATDPTTLAEMPPASPSVH